VLYQVGAGFATVPGKLDIADSVILAILTDPPKAGGWLPSNDQP
jgi:hypothetical protein